MDVLLLLLLILLNGVFAMSEIAVVSARKARLQRLAEDGSPGARSALALHNDPSRFLSTIQVGITSVGILSGAIGEAALADPLAAWLSGFPLLEPYARAIALTVVVVGLTYFSVVVGELVPKRLGLLAPEGIASLAARPMNTLAASARPLVWLLSSSANGLVRLLGVRTPDEPPVTDDEINVLMEQGAEAGVFHESEQAFVSNVLRLDELRVVAIMTHRSEVFAIDLADPEEEIRRRIATSPHTRVIVCRNGLEHVVGVLRAPDLMQAALEGRPLPIEESVRAPLLVPESMTVTQLLENFRAARTPFALIFDEYGEFEGLVTLTDVLGAIVGDLPSEDPHAEPDVVQRHDESWLVDGGVSVDRLRSVVDIEGYLPGEIDNAYTTIGGFMMHMLGRIPSAAERVMWEDLVFEVVDMDRNRVDKVLVTRVPRPPVEHGESV
jgi:putative hemolysin